MSDADESDPPRARDTVTLASAAFGAGLMVTGLFALLLSNAPIWLGWWGLGGGLALAVVGAWTLTYPSDTPWALLLGLLLGGTGVLLTLPDLWAGLRVVFTHTALPWPDLFTFRVTMGILSACYLSFVIAAAAWARRRRLEVGRRRDSP